MRITAAMTAQLARETDAACAGRQVRAVVGAPGGGHVLLLALPGEESLSTRVLIQTAAGRARMHVIPSRPGPRGNRHAPADSRFLREATKWLCGRLVTAVDALPGERIVTLHCAAAPGADDAIAVRLIAELFGAVPNLLVVDADDLVRAVLHRRAGARPAIPGERYVAPVLRGAPVQDPLPDLPAPATPFDLSFPYSALVDAWFHDLDQHAAFADERQLLVRALERELDRTGRLADQLAAQRAEATTAKRCRREADLLSANFHRLRPGLASIEVEDHFDGGMLRVTLDPALPPHANVERLYKRARKLERSAAGAVSRLCDARRRLLRLRRADQTLRATSGELPVELRAVLTELGIGKAPPARQTPRELKRLAPEQRTGIRSFVLRSGAIALVGKTNHDNDLLTQRVASGNDLWMHLQGAPGSHVVVRIQKGRTPTLEDLQDGAALAVYFSKRRGAARADVMYTQRKYVRKPKGSPAGAVTVDRYKTFNTLADPTRLQTLLGSAPA